MKTIGYCCLLLVFVANVSGCGGGSTADKTSRAIIIGAIEFQVPSDYVETQEPEDTLALRPSAEDCGVTLRMNVHSLEGADADAGVQFVNAQAKNKGFEATESEGKILFKEKSSFEEGGRNYEMTFWQIGFDDQVVVFSAEVDRSRKDEKDVIDCVIAIPEIIQSMKKR